MFTKDRKITYYASELSENISETPEGYLVCRNVPIARTGVQIYLGQEIGLQDKYDQEVKVYRLPEDVFAPEAIASFEGKPFTNNHPEPMVDITNLPTYGKGHAQNIRRSTTEPDLLLADIVATDPITISEIKNKVKREISSGYDCYYVPHEDGYKQIEIRGNHIALVSRGRAGDRVSIKDNLMERKTKMAKNNIFAAMLKAFAKDADLDEVAAAMDAITEKEASKEEAPMTEAPKEKEVQDEGEDPMAGLSSRLDALEERLNKLFADKQTEDEEEPEEKVEEPGLSEEEVEEIEEDVRDSDEEIEEEEKVVVSKDSLDSLKAAVARIRNPQDKRRASDALLKVYGRSSKATTNIYDSVAKLSAKSAKAKDSAPAESFEDLGRKIAAQWNPHYTKGE